VYFWKYLTSLSLLFFLYLLNFTSHVGHSTSVGCCSLQNTVEVCDARVDGFARVIVRELVRVLVGRRVGEHTHMQNTVEVYDARVDGFARVVVRELVRVLVGRRV
jgi:hypothetical protein